MFCRRYAWVQVPQQIMNQTARYTLHATLEDSMCNNWVQVSSAVPPLLDICCAVLRASLSPEAVCEVLEVADCLAPFTESLRAQVKAWARSRDG